jgi:endoglucanase
VLTARLFSWIIAACLVLSALPARSEPPAALLAHLRRGLNITGWFRFPASRDPAALARWIGDPALADLRRAGFDFVRLAIDPAVVDSAALREAAVTAVCRLRRQDLTVIVDAHPTGWHLETDAADRARLRAFWAAMAPALRRCDPSRIVPEVLNEPVFPGDAPGWASLQHAILLDLRAALPDSTILLTGADWGSIAGLLALSPEADPNVLYSFHFYDPVELTSLAAWRPGLDRAALARLPFPVTDRTACEATNPAANPTGEVARYYCATDWNQDAIAQRLGAAVAWAEAHHVHLLAGEFGATTALNPAARLAWLGSVRQALQAHGIGWALWGYDDIMGFAVPRPPPPRPILNNNILTALGLRPAGL